MQRRAVAWLLWWLACFWLYMLATGQWSLVDLLAAAAAAALAATLAETARALGRVAVGVAPQPLRSLPSALLQVPLDLWILTRALVVSLARREVVRGRYVARDIDPGDASHRAWTVLVATFSPNSYVVDVDEERGVVLLHDLVPNRRSERPA